MSIVYVESDFEELSACPWCGKKEYKTWGYKKNFDKFQTVECSSCCLLYVRYRYNSSGLGKYYSNYLNNIHQADAKLNEQRNQMYRLEYDLIKKYLGSGAKVLDVGCSGGYFMDFFAKDGHTCCGVEFGEAAAKEAARKYQVFYGDFPDIGIKEEFDIVIFRGVIEHVAMPRAYLDAAIKLMKPKGIVYITSTPNRDSVCCDVFKDLWNQHIPQEHLFHFSPRHFDKYFSERHFEKIEEKFFYEETPYAKVEEDIILVADAIKAVKVKGTVKQRSPAFYGNMMSVAYRKVD